MSRYTFADLHRLYHEQGMTITEVARHYGVSYRAIWQAMQRRGIARRSKARRNQHGANNPRWAGDRPSYFAAHKRVRKIRGTPSKCSRCDTTRAKRFDWANVSGRFEDPNDYIRLCVSCHSKFDDWGRNLQCKAGNSQQS